MPDASIGRIYDPTDPLYYEQYFGHSQETSPCEAALIDDYYAESIAIFGSNIEIYLCTQYDPQNVFGEDPLKGYLATPFEAKGVFEPTGETLTFGSFEKETDQDEIIIYFHQKTIRASIRQALIDMGWLEEDQLTTPDSLNKIARNRLDLQEGDIVRLHFNNIHYEIDGIAKAEPAMQPHLYKYIYEAHCRPRLVAGEDLGLMQPVTDNDKIIQDHITEIQTEEEELIF